jgi:hypothetical protein
MYSGQLIIDADYATDRWEIALRLESLAVAWSGVSDVELPEVIGHSAALSLITDRDSSVTLHSESANDKRASDPRLSESHGLGGAAVQTAPR